jgi:glycosyltransferase involved in cell wall biosynthesis
MRIALFLEYLLGTDTGGSFQQLLSTAEHLTRENATKHDFVVFTPYEQTRQFLLKQGIKAIRFKRAGVRLVDLWSATMLGNAVLRRMRRLGFKRLGRHLDALLDDHNIDLVITQVGENALRISDHPIIIAVLDVNHRDYPEFPEMYKDRLFERIDRMHRTSLTRALAIIANSPSGARRIAHLYQVDPDRIIELPFLPSRAVRRHVARTEFVIADEVRRKYDLPPHYVFYPAYFSFHKNHLYLLEGLLELERRHGIALYAIFCGGGDSVDLEAVQRQIQALGLAERVRFLGFVPDEDVPAIYERAVALVMPGYFGPTNLPPLEAATLGCPVIYSDLPEFREQMGDAALYCDLHDVSSLADLLAALIQDPALSDRLRNAGSDLATEIKTIDYGERLGRVLDRYAYVRRRWSWPETPDDRHAAAVGNGRC